MPPRSIRAGFAHLTLFLIVASAWKIGVEVVTLLVAVPDLSNMGSARDIVQALGPGGMGLSAAVQMLGLVGLATVGATLLPSRPNEGLQSMRARIRDAFALRVPRVGWILTAATAAITAGWLSAWIFEALLPWAPEGYEPTLVLVQEQLLHGGSASGRAMLLLSILLTAPLFEELVFRGYLWAALARSGTSLVPLLGTSVLFAAFHQEPLQSIALLPTAFFLGWLRWVTDSVWPSVAAHLAYNGFSAVVLLTVRPAAESSTPLWLGAAGYGITVAICAFGWSRLHRAPERE